MSSEPPPPYSLSAGDDATSSVAVTVDSESLVAPSILAGSSLIPASTIEGLQQDAFVTLTLSSPDPRAFNILYQGTPIYWIEPQKHRKTGRWSGWYPTIIYKANPDAQGDGPRKVFLAEIFIYGRREDHTIKFHPEIEKPDKLNAVFRMDKYNDSIRYMDTPGGEWTWTKTKKRSFDPQLTDQNGTLILEYHNPRGFGRPKPTTLTLRLVALEMLDMLVLGLFTCLDDLRRIEF